MVLATSLTDTLVFLCYSFSHCVTNDFKSGGFTSIHSFSRDRVYCDGDNVVVGVCGSDGIGFTVREQRERDDSTSSRLLL